jgi:hypothetical protein
VQPPGALTYLQLDLVDLEVESWRCEACLFGTILLAHGVGGDSVAKFDGFDGDGSAQGNNLPPKPV